MNLTAEMEYNRTALLRVVVMLFSMVGLVRGGVVATLPRHLRLRALRLLRPAESALRRLIVVEAREVAVALRPVGAAVAPKLRPQDARERKPSFRLIEPLQQTGPPAPRYAPGPGPRMFFFDGSDPAIEPAPPPLSPNDPVESGRLCRRLQALQAALEDLPKHARRLALWQARRDAAPPRSGRTSPLRPGSPPGHRKRGKHPVDLILVDCEILFRRALAPPDT